MIPVDDSMKEKNDSLACSSAMAEHFVDSKEDKEISDDGEGIEQKELVAAKDANDTFLADDTKKKKRAIHLTFCIFCIWQKGELEKPGDTEEGELEKMLQKYMLQIKMLNLARRQNKNNMSLKLYLFLYKSRLMRKFLFISQR